MSKQQHTPGPWFVNEENYEFEAHSGKLSVEAGDYFIAQVDECLSQEANARLIAAAPELLEALIEAEHWVSEFVSQMSAYTISDKAAESAVRIRTAIAKARGES